MRRHDALVSRTSGGLAVAMVMIGVIVAVDVAFLRDEPWVRLVTNIGIVAAFAVCYYLLVLRR